MTGSRNEEKLWNDGLSFLKIDTLLTKREQCIRKKTREVMEKHIREESISLWEKSHFDMNLIEVAKLLGPAGLQISKKYGGAGLTTSEAMIMIMEMGRVDASFGTFYVVHSGLAMQSIAVAGTEEQKQFWLPKMASYEKIGCFGLTEPEYGSDATNLKTKAKRVEGGWVLNGRKRWIGNATFADICILWARDVDSNNIKGFIVETHFKGFTCAKIENKISLRIVQNADIDLVDCFIPFTHVLAIDGFNASTKTVLESSRALVATACTGLLLGAYESASDYCRNRKQFGKPLANFQLVQERLMRVLSLVQCSVLASIHLGRLIDKNIHTMSHVALAKASISKMMREGVSVCREVVGGNGILLDYKVAKAFADAEALYTFEGTYDINMLIVGREIFRLPAFV